MYAVAGFGSAVANGVAQEKTSRTAEVLLAAIQPRELMIGKVIGIGLVGLGQMTITVGAAMIANALVKSQAIPAELPTLLPMILVWFVLGFALYAFGFAAAGALVARQEEVQSVTMPFIAFLVVGLLLVYATIASADSPWVRLLSFVPPLSPLLMPARLALGHPAAWEIPLAIVIELASIVGMATLAGRIYQSALVRGGARLSWASALRLR
jgi:ABC-2 type transport system permease protein